MKRFTSLVVALLMSLSLSATNYYLSNAGNDTNSGTSTDAPWATIDKLNKTSLQAGDAVYFRAGDIFRGTIYVNQSGTSVNPIVFTSYGSGAKPIISGAELVNGWTFNGTMYQAPFTKTLTSFFASNQEMMLARYPNDHLYLTLDSGKTNYIKDASITSLSSDLFTDAKICIHSAQWCWERTQVASIASDQINFSTNITLTSLAQYGYFVYGKLVHLDANNEFYYDNTAQILYYKSAVDPNTVTCEASVYTNGFEIGSSASYINISKLQIEKQTNAGIALLSETNTYVTIDNCEIKSQYNYGISDKGKYTTISSNTIDGADAMGIYCWGKGGNATIHHNTVKNIGLFRNYGDGSQINGTAIKCAFVDNCYIHHNLVDGAGYCGISADGGYHLVERNTVTNAMLTNNDGGSIHSFGKGSHHSIFQNNFVTAGDGNTEGTFKPGFITPAIYFDNDVNYNTAQNNTVYNRTQKGIFLNAGSNNNTIKGNVIYGLNYGIDFNGSQLFPTQMTGMNVSENVFFAKSSSAYMIRMVDNTGGYHQGTINNNYYFNPYNKSNCVIIPTSATTSTIYSLSDWQTNSNLDLQSKESFVSWSSNTSDETLFTNPSDDTITISLGTDKYVDLDNNEVCGSFSLAPYTSKILINSHAICSSLSTNSTNNFVQIQVAPNPFKTNIVVQLPETVDTIGFGVWNQLGQRVHEGKLNAGTTILELSMLPIGVYFLKSDNAEFNTFKIIKN